MSQITTFDLKVSSESMSVEQNVCVFNLASIGSNVHKLALIVISFGHILFVFRITRAKPVKAFSSFLNGKSRDVTVIQIIIG